MCYRNQYCDRPCQ